MNFLNFFRTGLQNAMQNKFGGLLDDPVKFMREKSKNNPKPNIGKLIMSPKDFFE